MTRVLVAFGSEEGQTSKIAHRVGELLAARGVDVLVRDCAQPDAAERLASFDGVVIGSAIHNGHHARQVRELVMDHRAILKTRRTAFFVVSLSAGGPSRDLAAARKYIEEFASETGWKADQAASFAGAIQHSRYGILKSLQVYLSLRKSGTPESGDHEYTDWKAVEAFADPFAKRLAAPKR